MLLRWPLLFAFLFSCQTLPAQVNGDYRTATSGNWSSPATWQMRTAGSWAAAATAPAATNNVFLQAGHTVTLAGSEACNNFNISTNNTGTRLSLGANTLSINGKLRAITDTPATTGTTDGTVPGTATDVLAGTAAWIRSTAGGGFNIVGNTRAVTTTGEWGANNSGTTDPNGFELTVTPPAGQTFSFETPLKARSITIGGAGTTDMALNRLAPDEGTAGSGTLTINGTLKSAGNSSLSNPVVARIATGTDRYCGTVTLNGTLVLTGSSPFIHAATITLKGTVVYARTGAQNLLDKALALAAFPGSYAGLTIEGGDTKTLSGPTTVSGALTLTSGRLITTTANLLTLGDTATVPTAAGSSNHVSGPLQKKGSTAFTFPIGKSGVFRAAGIGASAAATDAYTAEYFNAPYPVRDRNGANATPLQHISGKEYWIISRDAGTSTPNITLSFGTASSISPGGLSNLVLAHFNGTNWDNLGQVSTTGAASSSGTLTGSTGTLGSFSPFTFGTTNAAQPLPVSLLQFSGVPAGEELALQWQVAAGSGAPTFNIEKAVAGGPFQTIGAVRGAPPAGGSYHFTDGDFGAGIQLYRLLILEPSGSSHYSATLSFKRPQKAPLLPAVYPNPVGTVLHLHHLVPGGVYVVRSPAGKVLWEFTAKGADESFPVEALPAGTYFLRGEDGEGVRFVKL